MQKNIIKNFFFKIIKIILFIFMMVVMKNCLNIKNSSTTSDETGKIWDHPWSTDEMRQYRSDWNLAGDVGLLKHLQQFSEVYSNEYNYM